MSHSEPPEHCYDFHSVVKCFSPLNCWLVLDAGIKALTFEIRRVNSGEQKRSPQRHKFLLNVCRLGGRKASKQHGLWLPSSKSWSVQWSIPHSCLPEVIMSFWEVLHVAPPITSCSPASGVGGCGIRVLGAAVPCVCTEPRSAAPAARGGGVSSKFTYAKAKSQATTCGFLIK